MPTPSTDAMLAAFPEGSDSSIAKMLYFKHVISVVDSLAARHLQSFQTKRASQLINFAAARSNWWKNRIPRAARRLEDLPIMSRMDLQDFMRLHGAPLSTPSDHGEATLGSTTGSSGTVATYYTTELAAFINQAYYWNDRDRNGISLSDLVARFTVHIDDLSGGSRLVDAQPHLQRPAEILRKPQQFTIKEHAHWLSETQPTHVIAHPPIIQGIMDAFEELPLKRPRLKKILSFADTIPPNFRQRAWDIFGAQVIDRYSCQEIGPISFQCPHSENHQHIANANVILEILDENNQPARAGEVGRVHITGLNNYATPFIRYALGDLAAWSEGCPCGYAGKVISELKGRERFLAKLPSGERQYVNFGARHWLKVMPVKEGRLVQKREGHMTAEFVMEREASSAEKDHLIALLKAEISSELNFEIEQVEKIDWGLSYKRQDVISLI